MKINGNLEFIGGGQLINGRDENLATDPVAPVAGQRWFNTATGTYKGFDGTDVIDFGAGGSDPALGAVVTSIKGGAGLELDGTYLAPVGTNYLGGTTSLKDADSKLDTQIKANSDAVGAEVTARIAALAAEVTARNAAILVETDARIAADATAADAVSDQFSTESTARLAGDAANNTRVDGVQTEVNAIEAGVGLGVDGTYAAPADTAYLGTTTSVVNAMVALDAAIANEASIRGTADSSINAALTAENQARIDADNELTTRVEALEAGGGGGNPDPEETAARIAADAAIQAELDLSQAAVGLNSAGNYVAPTTSNYLNSTTTVMNALTTLDTTLKTAHDDLAAETLARTNADTTLTDALNAEILTRTTNDNNQQAEINAVEAGAGLEANGSYAAPTGSNYLNAAASLKDADFKLDAQVKVVADSAAANTTAITNEVTARNTAIASAIATEVTDRNAAIATAVGSKSGFFLYTSGAAATSHTVTHNLGNKYATVTVIDDTDFVIIPNTIKYDTINQLTVTFSVATSCKVAVSGLKA